MLGLFPRSYLVMGLSHFYPFLKLFSTFWAEAEKFQFLDDEWIVSAAIEN